MNIVLLNMEEAASGRLPVDDHRAKHILEVLGITLGGRFYIGVIGGKRGLATIQALDEKYISWSVEWVEEMQKSLPWVLLVGLPRPQTARKILQDVSSLGVQGIHFFVTEKGDPAYAQSSLWRDGEAEALLLKGAGQAFSTLVPSLAVHSSLTEAIVAVGKNAYGQETKVFLDIYEAEVALDAAVREASAALVAVGPERGWSEKERGLLRQHGYVGAHMGERVLRVETACVAAGAVVLAAMGVWKRHQL
ncbi:MAG: 16S rRNA (uracil(1498)-N(3))-methyltransferase [Puniceicoccales bacterium]|jgi:RsmE family RNA methyltransferase|nr:16S rRNA (uracil(1498)-N(3))-methyltransferase [Puniceicoccales bacterium]